MGAQIKKYDLIYSQKMVQYMWRYTLHMQSTQIPCAVVFDESFDFRVLARAVNVEIERNDCLRLRLVRGLSGIKEYFVDTYKLDRILVKDFASKEEQDSYFNADASKKLNVFAGETFRVIFFRSYNGKSGVYLNVSHMVMDAVATFIFFRDLIDVYDSLKNGTPMPRPLSRYEDVISKERDDAGLEERIASERKILEERLAADGVPHFSMVNGDKLLKKQRKLLHKSDLTVPHAYMPINDKTHFIKYRLSKEDSDMITRFTEENHLSAEWVIQLGFRLSFSRLCDNKNDTLFWVLCPRRKTVREKRCGGTMASPMPWREVLPAEMTFNNALSRISESQAFLFRYSDVPFTVVRDIEAKLFHLSIMQSANSMMFSYLPFSSDMFGERGFEYLGFNFGHYVMPLYTITMRDPSSGNYVFSYIHRLSLTKDEDVKIFHEKAVKAIISGIKSPDRTIGEIMEDV